MNRYAPHVYVIPEDDRDRQLVDGFILHDRIKTARVQVMPPSGGWSYVLKTFMAEYIDRLSKHQGGHVVMLVDFDDRYAERRKEFDDAVPDDLKSRVFVVGPKLTPELLSQELKMNYEKIGLLLAEECFVGAVATWHHDHLKHNEPDRLRLEAVSKPPARRCEVSGCRWQGATTSSIRGNTARRSDAVQRQPDARNARARF